MLAYYEFTNADIGCWWLETLQNIYIFYFQSTQYFFLFQLFSVLVYYVSNNAEIVVGDWRLD